MPSCVVVGQLVSGRSVMSGFPRTARVPAAATAARRGHATLPRMCNMPACNTFRSFSICLIIAIIITESPTSGFTIRRTDNTDGYGPDLSAEESSLLEVRHDLKRPNDIKSDSQTKVDGVEELSALANVKNKSIASEDVFLNSFLISKEDSNENPTQQRLITESNEITTVQESEENTNISKELVLSTKSTPTTNTKKLEDATAVVLQNSSQPKEAQATTTNIPKLIITGVLNFQTKSVTESDNSSEKQNSDKDFLKFISEIKNNTSNNDSSEVSTSTTFVSTYAAEDSMAKDSVAVDSTMDINNDITSTIYNDKAFSSEATHNPLQINASRFQITQSKSALNTEGTSQSLDTTEQFPETMTVEETSSVMAEPLMKKYTEIDRKRISSTTTDENTALITVNDSEIVNADNMRSRVSLENILNATPILSLEKLRHDLMSIPTQNVSEITQQTKDNPLSTFTTAPFTRTPKREMVSSMRAGFLDLTARTVEPHSSTATENREVNNVEQAMKIGNKTGNRFGSQSQLAEDEIKEELLKEEMLHDIEENAKRYHDEIYNVEGIRLLDGRFKEPKISQGNHSDDALSVKPISQDKSKLYTVSPNYKPMKKIDVQPSKQFVRDPDDNSWRNESISSLGIVFKPKNSSKSFTEVLKNKTGTEFTNFSDKNKSDQPELRERLEKIAEVRKSKKKKIDKFGETIYTDYEENSVSGEILMTPKAELGSELINLFTEAALLSTSIKTTSPSPSSFSIEPVVTTTDTTSTTVVTVPKQEGIDVHTTKKPKKFYNIAEYYDTNDEYDADYMHLSKLDLKKSPTPLKANEPTVTQPIDFPHTRSTYSPDRKATLQYFPPRIPPKVKYGDYDDNFQKKNNEYPYKNRGTFGTEPTLTIRPNKHDQTDYNVKPLHYTHMYKPIDISKNLYLTSPTRSTGLPNGYGNVNDGNYNRPTYVIKQFNQDFISDTKDNSEDKAPGFLFTEPSVRGVTINDLEKSVNKIKLPPDDDYEYESQFRKDIMDRFVDNFNQNSEKYKVEFPILYNNSVVHGKVHENGKTLASSSAFMKRLYNDVTAAKVNNFFMADKACDPHCDNITVELSPAYELHYYVPDQEEKEEIDRRSTLSYRYRL